MSLARCFDAAYPPPTVPGGAAAVLGYIGPDPAAYHVWSLAEWEPFHALRQFPCRVVDYNQLPEAQAQAAFAEMRALGWRPHRALIYDMEAVVDPAYTLAFETAIAKLGPVPVAYESESVIGRNHATHVWGALWDGKPVLPAGWWAKQFMSGGDIDWSVVSPELLIQGGVGRRV